MLSGCAGQPGMQTIGTPRRDRHAPAEEVGQAHRAGRVVLHRRHAAVGRAGADGDERRGLRREPVDPLVDGDRLPVDRVDAEPGPVALAAAPLVADRALDDEQERVEQAVLRVVPGLQEVGAVLVGEHRVVQDHARAVGDDAAEQVLEARRGRARHRDRLAVAAEAGRHPQDVDRLRAAAGGAAVAFCPSPACATDHGAAVLGMRVFSIQGLPSLDTNS